VGEAVAVAVEDGEGLAVPVDSSDSIGSIDSVSIGSMVSDSIGSMVGSGSTAADCVCSGAGSLLELLAQPERETSKTSDRRRRIVRKTSRATNNSLGLAHFGFSISTTG
jgi:hypothetical protein